MSVLLGLLSLALYWPTLRHGFINLDDPDYVTANPQVQAGLSGDNLRWAFTQSHSSNWHPLTWISHMLDCQLFGLQPWGHHLTNVWLHALNTALVFLALRSLTGSFWRAALVAAFFGAHPLHVESVAWVSERKDLLSGLFFLLTLWAYGAYARSPAGGKRAFLSYGAAWFCFALGLLSKPMLVTLPCLLLLLDYWPLARLGPEPGPGGAATASLHRGRITPVLGRLLLEKVPFLALAFLCSWITYRAQHGGGATVSMNQMPLELRLGNAVLSWTRYLGKTLWPVDLAPFYPFTAISGGMVAGAAFILLLITVVAVYNLRRRPYLPVGWFWFVGMLVPVIGLVQVGQQAWADRYTYLPHIGLFMAMIWAAAEASHRWRNGPKTMAIAAVLALIACASLTIRQVPLWRDTKALFTHTLSVTRNNYVAHTIVAGELFAEGKPDQAREHCLAALRISPGYPEAHNTLAAISAQQGDLESAIASYREALKFNPDLFEAQRGLGSALAARNQFTEAEPYLREVLRRVPSDNHARYTLALCLHQQGRLPEAATSYEQVVRADPQLFAPRRYLGNVLAAQGKSVEAIAQFQEALKLKPDDADTRTALGVLLLEQGRAGEAVAQLQEAVKLAPTNGLALYQLALAHQSGGQAAEAIEHYRRALAITPSSPELLNNLAWLLATHPQAQLRNGPEAVQHAEKACELTGDKIPVFLGTLAAAYAESGRFPEAVALAEKAEALARAAGQTALAEKNLELLRRYHDGQPARE